MKIIVHPLLPTGNFLNCRIGVEKDYPDDYSLEQAINTEWDNLIAIHMKRYPHLYDAVGKPLYEAVSQQDEYRGSKVVDVNPVNTTIQGIIEDIGNCTEVYQKNGLGVQTGLVAYEDAAAKFPEIKAAYDLKMLQLTKNQ